MKKSGSSALSVEAVVDKCENSDVWLFRYGGPKKTVASMASENKSFTHIKAYKDKNLWGCSTERTAFYEDTPFHPDVLLGEFLRIFHSGHSVEMKYFEKID